MDIEMNEVTEYCEGRTVYLAQEETNGRTVVRAVNEGGYNCTEVDIVQLLEWLKKNRPDLMGA